MLPINMRQLSCRSVIDSSCAVEAKAGEELASHKKGVATGKSDTPALRE